MGSCSGLQTEREEGRKGRGKGRGKEREEGEGEGEGEGKGGMRALSSCDTEGSLLQLTTMVVDDTLYGERGPRGVEKGIA